MGRLNWQKKIHFPKVTFQLAIVHKERDDIQSVRASVIALDCSRFSVVRESGKKGERQKKKTSPTSESLEQDKIYLEQVGVIPARESRQQ